MEETKKVHNNPGIQFIAAVAVITVLVGGGYMLVRRGSSSVQTGTNPGNAGAQETTDMSVISEEVQEVTIEAKEFSFSPSVITVKAGQPVRIRLQNTGKMPHDWVIDGLAKTSTIKSGETDTIEFTPTEAGTFSFYCSVGNHRAQGMEGKLTVN